MALDMMDAQGTDETHIGDDWTSRFECEATLGLGAHAPTAADYPHLQVANETIRRDAAGEVIAIETYVGEAA